jgi:hypothetical protein
MPIIEPMKRFDGKSIMQGVVYQWFFNERIDENPAH